VLGSIPTAPTIHLLDGWTLNKKTRGQKGADKTVGPVFLCEFSAVRVTTGYVGLKVQGSISLDAGHVESQVTGNTNQDLAEPTRDYYKAPVD
jgi:hypothetical protein